MTSLIDEKPEVKASWRPMIALALAQVLMSFNVSALPVSLGGMVDDFDVAPTRVSTAIVMYGLAVAALVMTGAKIGQRIGWVLIFRIVIGFFLIAQVMMVLSPSVEWVIAAQLLAGASAAIIVPSLVALIAENYRGAQQATAIGSLGSARAASGVSAFLIGGLLGTHVGWRPVFGLLIGLGVIVFFLSFSLKADGGNKDIKIDGVAAILIGAAVVMLTLGINNLNNWGLLTSTDDAPFDLLGLSPAIILITLGIVLGQAFFVWTRRRSEQGNVPLISLDVISNSKERAAVYAMFIIVALEAAINFTVPLYIQIVQGRTPIATSISMMPFNLTVFFTAILVVRFYKRFDPRTIGRFGFTLSTVALVWLSIVVNNNWQTVPTIVGLITFGIGQGALVTLVFNVLVTASPKELAGDVGSLRGTTQNLASAVGTAMAGALLVTLLSIGIGSAVLNNVKLPESVIKQSEIKLDSVNFISNDNLRDRLEKADIPSASIEEAIKINTDERLRALRIGLLILACVSALAIFPASRLPNYKPDEIPDPSPTK